MNRLRVQISLRDPPAPDPPAPDPADEPPTIADEDEDEDEDAV
jgi:hypothetical protein